MSFEDNNGVLHLRSRVHTNVAFVVFVAWCKGLKCGTTTIGYPELKYACHGNTITLSTGRLEQDANGTLSVQVGKVFDRAGNEGDRVDIDLLQSRSVKNLKATEVRHKESLDAVSALAAMQTARSISDAATQSQMNTSLNELFKRSISDAATQSQMNTSLNELFKAMREMASRVSGGTGTATGTEPQQPAGTHW